VNNETFDICLAAAILDIAHTLNDKFHVQRVRISDARAMLCLLSRFDDEVANRGHEWLDAYVHCIDAAFEASVLDMEF
jgi:Fe-S-cluster formation regulator IscX/YfhJ